MLVFLMSNVNVTAQIRSQLQGDEVKWQDLSTVFDLVRQKAPLQTIFLVAGKHNLVVAINDKETVSDIKKTEKYRQRADEIDKKAHSALAASMS